MKITEIQMTNWMSHRRTSLALTPLTVIAGPNGAGKSNVREALEFALIATVPRIEAKNQRDALLSEGAAGKGSVALSDGAQTIERDISSGKMVRSGSFPLPETAARDLAPIVLQPSRFAAMDAAGRSKALQSAMRVDLGVGGLIEELRRREYPADLLDVLQRADTLEEMVKKASAGASEARGAWKAVTGQTYGSQKAEDWQPEGHDEEPPDATTIYQANQARDHAQADMDHLQRQIGALDAQEKAGQNQAALRDSLTRKIALKEPTLSFIEDLKAQIADAEAQYEKAYAIWVKAKNSLPKPTIECPCCRAALLYSPEGGAGGKPVLFRYATPDNIATVAQVDAAKVLSDAAWQELSALRDKLEAANAKLRDAVLAEANLKELDPFAPAEPLIRRDDIERQLESAKSAYAAAAKAVTALEARKAAAESRVIVRRKAAAHHQEVKAWLKIGEELAPAGIPGELLARALKPFNDTLRGFVVAGWKQVRIENDMTITADGRPYRLLCESEQWRVDAMIGVALAHHSELRLLCLDRFDVLEPAARKPALVWLYQAIRAGMVETCLLLATLKEPLKTPPDVASHWLGAAVEQRQAA